MKKLFFFCLFGLLFMSCSPKAGSGVAKDTKEMKLDEKNTTPGDALESYLRRASGVYVSGSGENLTVKIRGNQTVRGNTSPLYVLNGRDVGKSYANANSLLKGMVIKSVRVLKSSEASVYGARGFGGVILIKAK